MNTGRIHQIRRNAFKASSPFNVSFIPKVVERNECDDYKLTICYPSSSGKISNEAGLGSPIKQIIRSGKMPLGVWKDSRDTTI